MNPRRSSLSCILALASIMVASLIWVFIQGEYYVQGNVSWLIIAAERILQGKDLLDYAYETNPPLGILIYIPSIFLSDMLHLPIYRGLFIFTSFMVLVSCVSSWLILNRIDSLGKNEKLLFITAFFCSITIATNIYLSERDHYIAIWLLPFVLCQYCITEKIKLPCALQFIVLLLGAVAILIKPNFGIMPVAMLMGRMIRNKVFFNVIKDADFLMLSVATLGYIFIVFTFFESYAFVIFPDALQFYFGASATPNQIINGAMKPLSFFIFTLAIELFFSSKRSSEQKHFVFTFYTCGAISCLAYFMQAKGFDYHLLPANVFIIVASSLTFFHVLGLIKPNAQKTQIIFSSFFILLPILIFTSWSNLNLPRHDDIKEEPLSLYLAEECPDPCTYFMFHYSIEIVNPTTLYTGYEHASRFPVFWFLPKIIEKEFTGHEEEAHIVKHRYASYITEDLQNYKPSILLIASDLPVPHYPNFDLIKYFQDQEAFRQIIEQHYRKEPDKFAIEISDYYPTAFAARNHVEYDVYKRILP